MTEKIDQAIKVLMAKITPAIQPDQALKFTQSALNLAHVKTQMEATFQRKTKGAGA